MNGTVTGGNKSGNNVSISNGGSVTATHLVEADLLATATQRAKDDKATAAARLATNSSNRRFLVNGKYYDLTNAAQKQAAIKAYAVAYPVTATPSDAEITTAKKAILAGQTVAATGVAVGNVSAGGNLTIGNSVAVSVTNPTSLGTSQSATGVVVSGGSLTAGGAVVVSSTANITGANAATGVMLSPNVQSSYNRTTRRTSYSTSAVVTAAGNISITQTGAVAASSGTAYGVSADMMNSTGGKVSIRQHGDVTGSETVANSVAMGVVLSGNVTAATGIDIYQGYVVDNAGSFVADGRTVRGNVASGVSFTGALNTAKGDINVAANGSVSGALAVYGLNSNNTTLTASNGSVSLKADGTITSSGGAVTGLNQLGSVYASGTITVTSAGKVTANNGAANGMVLNNLTSYRGITVTESAGVTSGSSTGTGNANGLVLNGTLWSAGSISATQSGNIEVKTGAVAKGWC